MTVRPLSIPTPKGAVSAVWHPADGPALVVGHGAGAGMDHPFIVGFCEAVADEGIAALRFNFPYMEAGRRTPDQAKNAIGAFRSAYETATERSDGRPVLELQLVTRRSRLLVYLSPATHRPIGLALAEDGITGHSVLRLAPVTPALLSTRGISS